MSDQKYIVLDRDGVINVDLFDYVTKPADFKFEDGSLEALSILSDNNFKIIVATNQACISLGIASKDQIDNVNSHMKQKVREHGSDIIHVEVCLTNLKIIVNAENQKPDFCSKQRKL